MDAGYGIKVGDGNSAEPIVVTKENCISRGRYISKLEFRKSDKAEWLNIEVKDREGRIARRSYFPPAIGLYVKDEAALTKEKQKFNSMMRNLTGVLLSPKYETGPVSSFAEFCNKVISDIGKSYHDKELRIKLVYNSKNQPSLPNWPVMFEDPIVISDEMSKMKITEHDKVAPVAVAMDSEPSTSTIPSKSITADDIPMLTVKKTEDDLPF